jgi:membrane-associated phospholipid phosphatase
MTTRIDTQHAQPGLAERVWIYTGGWVGLALRLGIVVLAALAASQHVLRGDSLLILLAIAVPGALLARRGAMPLAIYTTAWLAFSLIRAIMDDLGMPDQGGFIAQIDRLLAGGLTPTERLQDAFYTPGSTGILDLLTTSVHTSYYVMPHLVAVGLWWYGSRTGKRLAFRTYLAGSIAVMALGLLLYGLLPTSPPWIEATVDDQMLVHRITRASNAGETRDPDQVYTFFTDPNPIAAMPSLHTAITVVMAAALWRVRPALGIAGGVYALAMGFSLIYLGEHYLIDVLAGAALAISVTVVVGRWLADRRLRWAGHLDRNRHARSPATAPGD